MSFGSAEYEERLSSIPVRPLGFDERGRSRPAQHRFSLVACARWEQQYIEEWLLYHRSIGFDHAYVYCNDDDPAPLYRSLLALAIGDKPFVTFIHYQYQGLQFQMYLHYLRNFSADAEYVMMLDIDEFLVLKHVNDIAAFVDNFAQEFDALYFNWCYFGTSGHKQRPAGDVMLNYTRRQQVATPFTKILIDTAKVPYAAFFRQPKTAVMHDVTCLDPQLRALNVLGAPMLPYYAGFPASAWDYLLAPGVNEQIIAVAFVAHFHMKSDADFNIRVARGLKGDFAAEAMWGSKTAQEREEHNRITNAVEDTYLRDYWMGQLDGAWRDKAFPRARWSLLSRNCPARQSSTLHAPRTTVEDAAAVVSGIFAGGSQNHTELEDFPWWQVDLQQACLIREVWLFNRLDGVQDRVARFRIAVSADGTQWATAYEKLGTELYGGIDGTPWICVFAEAMAARHLRITILATPGYLHFDQVEVYGSRMADGPQA